MIAEYKSSGTVEREVQPGQQRSAYQKCGTADWQLRFLSLLPSICEHAEFRFRHQAPEAREELIQETVSRALVDYRRLVERGKEHLAYAGPLAKYAIAQVRQGRRVGGRLNAQDVSTEYCRNRKGVSLESLDRLDESCCAWREILVEDRCSTPAEIAGARIDVSEWLKTLPPRSRRLAEGLAAGESTSGAARSLGVSSSRVSQLRRELHRAWNTFQGEPVSTLL